VSTRTRAGLLKVRPAGPGSRVGLVAPASPFDRGEFDRGVAELRRLGFDPVFDERIFEKRSYVAGEVASRVAQLTAMWKRSDVDAVIAVRGGYGSLQMLPALSDEGVERIGSARTAFVGYSDVTSLHVWLNCCVGMASIHGPMIDRRLSRGPAEYDVPSFLASLAAAPMGELSPGGIEILKTGEASGPLFGPRSVHR
jgi:muramoyltetrapeptide carboxypeptidase